MKGFSAITIVAFATPALSTTESLIQVTSSGAFAPFKIFDWTTDPTTNFKVAGGITPLGQRQQYYIGDELRERYVNDVALLDSSFNIMTTYMQSKFNSRSSISLEAQMIGLYPPSSNNLKLTAWQ